MKKTLPLIFVVLTALVVITVLYSLRSKPATNEPTFKTQETQSTIPSEPYKDNCVGDPKCGGKGANDSPIS